MSLFIPQVIVLFLLQQFYKNLLYFKRPPYFIKEVYLSKILFINPCSKNVPNIFFNIINIIGPISIPITPINLKPVYIAINVNIGCIPILFPIILGSKNCLIILINVNKPKIANPKVISPSNPAIIAHGIITVAEPNIGKASTKPIPKCC